MTQRMFSTQYRPWETDNFNYAHKKEYFQNLPFQI